MGANFYKLFPPTSVQICWNLKLQGSWYISHSIKNSVLPTSWTNSLSNQKSLFDCSKFKTSHVLKLKKVHILIFPRLKEQSLWFCPFWSFWLQIVTWNYNEKKRDILFFPWKQFHEIFAKNACTIWKLKNFSVVQILREITFCEKLLRFCQN